MEWTDNGIIVGRRSYGESHSIIELFTENHGKRNGLVHGATSKRRQPFLELGNTLNVTWKGRSHQQLGYFSPIEPVAQRANRNLESPLALCAIGAVTAMLRTSLDEGDGRESSIYESTEVLLDAINQMDIWPALYVKWEVFLLSTMGFGLDFTRCAVTGHADGLTHMSPRTGKAVRGKEAPDYVDRLLEIPEFLIRTSAKIDKKDIRNGLNLTGYFIKNRLYAAINKPPPTARDILIEKLVLQVL